MASELRECPFCKEDIKADATRCKHCRSIVAPEKPPHGGICPYCREGIRPEAIKCKHCGSMLAGRPQGACCEGCAGSMHADNHPTFIGASGGETTFGPIVSDPAARAGCTACTRVMGFDVNQGGWIYFGVRKCTVRLPKRFNPDGTIAEWTTISWDERCGDYRTPSNA